MCCFLPELLSLPSAVLPPQVIGLLDVFTPDESLDDFTDLWVLLGLWRADSGAGWRGFLGVYTIGGLKGPFVLPLPAFPAGGPLSLSVLPFSTSLHLSACPASPSLPVGFPCVCLSVLPSQPLCTLGQC